MNNLGSAGTLEVFVRAPIQPEFVDLVADARAAIASDLGEALDSLYLYGSVARGCARAGFSDLDLTVVHGLCDCGRHGAAGHHLRASRPRRTGKTAGAFTAAGCPVIPLPPKARQFYSMGSLRQEIDAYPLDYRIRERATARTADR